MQLTSKIVYILLIIYTTCCCGNVTDGVDTLNESHNTFLESPENKEQNEPQAQVNSPQNNERNLSNGPKFTEVLKDMIPQPMRISLIRKKRSSCFIGGNVLCAKNCRLMNYQNGNCDQSYYCICM